MTTRRFTDPPQTNRYFTVVCEAHEDGVYRARMTRAQMARGMPGCGVCGNPLSREDGEHTPNHTPVSARTPHPLTFTNTPQEQVSRAITVAVYVQLKDTLEARAYAWAAAATDQPGLLFAAEDLLVAINRGRLCAICARPITDPENAPDDDTAVCSSCGVRS